MPRRLAAIVRSNRFTLGGALLFGVMVPELLRPYFLPYLLEGLPLSVIAAAHKAEVLASIFAIVVAHFSLQRMNTLPLVDNKMAILPTFIGAYCLTVSLLWFVMRVGGRFHIGLSFIVVVIWYFAVALARVHMSAPRLAFVGSMAKQDDLLNTSIEWVPLHDPSLPRDILGVVFDKQHKLPASFQRLFARAVLRGIPVYEVTPLREMATGRVRLSLRPEEKFGSLFPSRPYLRVRRLLDLLLGLPALILALPIIALFAVLIRFESPGPAIFQQQRVGHRGRPFTCFKLRSMRVELGGLPYTTEQDPRITRIGSFIRKTRIDELPQIVNILKGDMGWIGPRPEALALSRRYSRDIPYYGYRHLVRPGITGWAAVHQGNVALTEAVTRKLEYDFFYIKHFSPWLDFLIVLMTVRTVLTGHGSR